MVIIYYIVRVNLIGGRERGSSIIIIYNIVEFNFNGSSRVVGEG